MNASSPVIPQTFIQDLLHRVDIVEVVDRHVKLKRVGANYVACCPFHSENSPSFTVSPSKQFYHCFGCGAHGTAIGFMMEYGGSGFVEAVRDLAQSVGMKAPEEEDSYLTLLLIRTLLREWAQRRRRAVARGDDSDDVIFGQVLGALSLAQLCALLTPHDLERLEARMHRVMEARVTRLAKLRKATTSAESAT